MKLNGFFIFFLAFIIIASASAQNKPGMVNGATPPQGFGTVSGTIVDKESGQIVEYANIVLFRVKDSTMVTGSITDTKGKFRIEKVPFGMYYATASFIGFNQLKLSNVKVNPKTPDVDLGKISLESASTGLSTVTITGERRTMEYTLDKKVVNVEKDISSMGGSAIDVLKNVPSVTVDIDGGVALRGSSNVTILIDGRPSGITGTSLDQLPASSIETVEVITNPSARYNPEGMSGIINIKLRKKRELGLNGILTLNAGTGDKYNGSLNLNYNVKKFNFFASEDIRFDRREGWGTSNRTTFINDSTSLTSAKNESWRKHNSNGFKLGVDMAITPTQNLTLSYYRNRGDNKSEDKSYSDFYYPLDTLAYQYDLQEKENGQNFTNDYTLAYKKTFQNKGQEFTLDAVYSQSPDDEESDTYRNYTDGTLPAPEDSRDQTMTESTRDNLNIQANYVHPFSKDLRLEGGYQGIIRSTDDDYEYFIYDPDLAVFNIDTALSNHFVYDENIHAIYGIVGHTLGKFSYQAGLRYEMASTKADQRTMEEVYTKSYNSLYPTLHLNYKLPLEQEVQLSYSRRVNRPNMWSLNPFVDYSVPGMIRYGNPYLTPEYINATELGYSKYWKKSTLNGSIFYRYIDDVIKRYMFLDTNGILNYTSKNLTSGTSYGLELVFDTEIFKWWKLSVNGSYFKNEVKGAENGTDLSNSNYSWNSRLNSNMVLPKKIMFQFTANYRGPQLNLQGTMSANFTCDLALRKDFYKDKISLSFRLSDIFKTSKFEVENSGEGFSADMARYRESRVAYLGLTVKFGKDQKPMKRSKKMENGGEGGEEF